MRYVYICCTWCDKDRNEDEKQMPRNVPCLKEKKEREFVLKKLCEPQAYKLSLIAAQYS